MIFVMIKVNDGPLVDEVVEYTNNKRTGKKCDLMINSKKEEALSKNGRILTEIALSLRSDSAEHFCLESFNYEALDNLTAERLVVGS